MQSHLSALSPTQILPNQLPLNSKNSTGCHINTALQYRIKGRKLVARIGFNSAKLGLVVRKQNKKNSARITDVRRRPTMLQINKEVERETYELCNFPRSLGLAEKLLRRKENRVSMWIEDCINLECEDISTESDNDDNYMNTWMDDAGTGSSVSNLIELDVEEDNHLSEEYTEQMDLNSDFEIVEMQFDTENIPSFEYIGPAAADCSTDFIMGERVRSGRKHCRT